MKTEELKLLIETLNLQPHPEGGYYSETYRSKNQFHMESPKTFPHGRNYSTGIYYLLRSEDFSCFHRIKSDEMWHYYNGSSATIHMIDESGSYKTLQLGSDYAIGQKPQIVVPANVWFGVTVDVPECFVLCGCTVSPGFSFEDFEMADRQSLIDEYPEHQNIIANLTRDSL